MIVAVCWVPKGASKMLPAAAESPSQEKVDQDPSSGLLDESAGGSEFEDEEQEQMEIEDDSGGKGEASHALAAARALSKGSDGKNSSDIHGVTDGLQELNMDAYDDEDDGIELFTSGLTDVYYPSNDMDPYLKGQDVDDEDEIEDMTIKATDGVIVCTRSEDDISILEVSVFEESEDGESNLFVHHEIILSAFPLCTAWLDCNLKSGDKGNFIAIGSMEPTIEIWDLDMIDEVQPFIQLGGTKKKKKAGKKKDLVKFKKGSHESSVLGLAWNKEFRNVLASASADQSVKIWDMVAGQCVLTLKYHSKEVQAVAWSPHSSEILLSGSFDRTIAVMDGRSSSDVQKYSVKSEIESLAWDPFKEHSCVVSLDNGMIQGFDVRMAASEPTFTLHAHDKEATSISYNPSVANLLATGSVDKMVKLWDLKNNQPSCIASINPKAGAVFSVSFSEDSPFLLAIGGSKGKLQVWDTMTDPGVEGSYPGRGSKK